MDPEACLAVGYDRNKPQLAAISGAQVDPDAVPYDTMTIMIMMALVTAAIVTVCVFFICTVAITSATFP